MKCKLCDSEDHRLLLVKRGRRILRCRQCGLRFVEVEPPRTELDELYGQNYFFNYNRVKYGYENYLGHRHLYADLFLRRLEAVERIKRGGRLLDVGCATGILLDIARFRGWEVQGVDLSPFASDIARRFYNLDVFTGTLEEAAFPAGRFDLVFMHDVIEHAPDPLSLLRETCRVLADDGLVVINTPNAGGFWARALGRRWFHYEPRSHLFYFSPRTLAAMLEKAGLRQRRCRRAGRVINMEYMVGRLSYDVPLLSRFLGSIFRGGPLSKSTFVFCSGEMEVYAGKALPAGSPGATYDQVARCPSRSAPDRHRR